MLNKSKVITIGLGVTVMAGALFSFTKGEGEGDEKKKMYHVIHQHDGELMEYDTILPMSSTYSVENFLADKGIEDDNVEIIKVPSMGNHFMFKGEGEEGEHVMIKEMNRTMVIDGEGESENVMIQVEIDDEGNKVIKKTVNGEVVEMTEEDLEKMHHTVDGEHTIIELKSDGVEFDAEDVERIEISVEMDDEGNKVIKKTVNGVEFDMTEEELEKMESNSDRLHKGHHEHRVVIDHFDDSDMTEEEKAELMDKLKNEMHGMIIELDSLGEGMEMHFETLIEEIHEMDNENGDVQIMIRKMDGTGSEVEWISDGQHETRMMHSGDEDFTIVIVTEDLSNDSDAAPQVKREMEEENEMVIFPNPNKGVFTIQFDQPEKQKTRIEIVDTQGKVVFEENLGKFSGQYKKEIDLKKNGSGIYLIKIQQGKKLVSNKVIVD